MAVSKPSLADAVDWKIMLTAGNQLIQTVIEKERYTRGTKITNIKH